MGSQAGSSSLMSDTPSKSSRSVLSWKNILNYIIVFTSTKKYHWGLCIEFKKDAFSLAFGAGKHATPSPDPPPHLATLGVKWMAGRHPCFVLGCLAVRALCANGFTFFVLVFCSVSVACLQEPSCANHFYNWLNHLRNSARAVSTLSTHYHPGRLKCVLCPASCVLLLLAPNITWLPFLASLPCLAA